MTRTAKLYAAILANPDASHSFRDFERLLLAFGFEHKRTSGSHRIYTHSDVHPAARRTGEELSSPAVS